MTEKIQVLLVEDEQTLAMIIKDTLDGQGFEVSLAYDGEEGLRRFWAERPDVLVADVMMPLMDGFEMVRRIRKMDTRTPILFLTARSAIGDVVEGFELGANDYLKKPFSMQELIVRIKALMGRASIMLAESDSSVNSSCLASDQRSSAPAKPTDKFTFGQYIFDATRQSLVHVPTGQTSELSYRESGILHRLLLHQGDVVTSQSLLLDLWGDDSFFNNKSLHVFITKLRHYFSADPTIKIVNVRGIGYRLI